MLAGERASWHRGHSPRRRLVLMWLIGVSYPMVMAVTATVRSQKAVPVSPISPISPIRSGRRSCIKPREALSLETISKIRGAGLKPVACASRLVVAAEFFRRDTRPCKSERTASANAKSRRIMSGHPSICPRPRSSIPLDGSFMARI
jgi:hypothetical protein